MSLLKRIEQSQTPSQPQPGAPNGRNGANAQQDQASKLAELRMRRAAPPMPGGATASGAGGVVDLKTRVQNKLLIQLDTTGLDLSRTADVRHTIEDLYETILA